MKNVHKDCCKLPEDLADITVPDLIDITEPDLISLD